MTKDELAANVAEKTGVSKTDVRKVLEAATETVVETLAKDEAIYIRNFGTLLVKTRRRKLARNISQGTSVVVPARRVPFFKPARSFKNQIPQVE